MRRMWPAAIQRASSAHSPRSTATPASRSTARPRPAISGLGSSMAHTTRRDAGGDDGVGAGRRAAVMRAGLERDVHGLAARPRAGARQRVRLRVRPAALLRPAARDHLAGRLVGDDGADGRIGRGAAEHAPRHAQRQLHEAAVRVGGGGVGVTGHRRSVLPVGRLDGARLGRAPVVLAGRGAARRSRPAPRGSRPPRGSRDRPRQSARRRRGRDPSAPP